jgi:deazaflavin-dependent oxidoreductase (nitroreductase family)
LPYIRPPLFVRRVFNPLAMRFGIGGSRTLTVAGRRTGRPQRVPLIPVEHDGARYLVSPRGDTDWVRNLRAAGHARLGSHRAARDIRVTEVPAGERAEIIAAYRAVAGRAVRSFFEAMPDPDDHPVFRIEHPDG